MAQEIFSEANKAWLDLNTMRTPSLESIYEMLIAILNKLDSVEKELSRVEARLAALEMKQFD